MSYLQKEIVKSKTKNMPTPASLSSKLLQHKGQGHKRDYEPVSWTQYFSERKTIVINEDTFHVYIQGTEGPLLVLLHGGGYSALTWSQFTKSVMSLVTCRVMAVDLRGHGSTTTTNDDELSIEILAADTAHVLEAISENQPVVLVGHSLGGAVAVRTAPLVSNVVGVVVIDVVEGTAIDALRSMQGFLRSRPSSFSSMSKAIEWCVRSGQIRNLHSAKVSVPGQIKNVATGTLGTDDLESEPTTDTNTNVNSAPLGGPMENTTIKSDKYTWRINLAKTEQYWNGWFHGLSSAFLELSAPKMLLLAGVDRLDRELTVGQMQGKFQLQVLTACGHAVQEDAPEKVAEAVATFLVRHKYAEPTSEFTWTVPAC
ncbi:protein phosphatase methylesterase 1 [Copidosoma floridanum]|uniref:protein phosphatase methylesterase 1 n=1 Tax=Copidosoma floridanum TaxID=29053 RepID=UPI000C6F55F3|nr:protein phosphatase methylesterase 1 [Copidosoma floridanum]